MAGTLAQSLRKRLAQYDGRATTILGEIEAEFGGGTDYLRSLIDLAADPDGNTADGATWLLKAAIEAGTAIELDQVDALFAQLPQVRSWPAQLHLCQSVRYLPISTSSAAGLADWLKPLLNHERPFLRAWSLDALGRLAREHPKYDARFGIALQAAEQDTAASVRARARNLGRGA
ncbi:hypothetical protein [uncultured Erythrobacter sp.]|uniref:hypothetical protein n=1 Tax=uncultured Erythrobacter sp. TaxID=263913 RepID=UPI00261D0776|nr:hypothetical protein [uncultured Erythrobacter sp.]